MLRLFSPVRLLVAGLLVAAVALALWVFPTESYIFLPNRAHPVAPLVEVAGGKDPRTGGIYYVDVLVRKATLVERLFPGLREGATVVPAEQVRPPGVSEDERRQEELQEMQMSQRVAAAVALRELGYKVEAKPIGARIEFVDAESPAAGKLLAGDTVTRAGGKLVTGPAGPQGRDPRERDRPRRAPRREARRQGDRVHVRPKLGAEGTPMIGVIISQAADIKLPVDVEIDTDGVGGPSAGLAFALDLMEELGRDVDHGNRIAVTGALDLDGTVGEIGGVKQKTIGVERAGIKVFLVPAGDNAAEARRYADGIRIVPVTSFQQALRTLATLPEARQD